MKRIRSWFGFWFGSWFRQDEWPFMMFLTFVFIFIFIWTLIDSQRLRDPLTLVVFTVLFNAHLALHWLNFKWLEKGWSVLLYLLLQSALIFTLVSMSGSIGPLIGLYMGMIGESAGLLGKPWKIALGVLAFLGLSAVNYWFIMGDLSFQWWALAIFPMTFFVIIYVLLYTRQAEARERAQKLLVELEAANRQLTENADRIEDLTLANERQRMARELHDTLAQGLAGLILQLEAADSHLASGNPDRARGIVEQAMARARTTLADSRKAIDNLRSGQWRPADLAEAVRLEADQFRSMTGTPCAAVLDLPAELPEPARDLALRAVAEGLSNAARHARASAAKVDLATEAGRLRVIISDDGAGFDPARIPPGHYGLIGLRERVRQAGGSMEIRSRPGDGTELRVTVPLDQSASPGKQNHAD